MKFTAFLLFCGVLNLMAGSSYSQSTKISLNIKDATIEDVLNRIENQSEFYFLYNQKLIDVTRKVSVEAENESIKDILAGICGNDIGYVVLDRQIILTPRNEAGKVIIPEQQRISGKVTDKSGSPVPGVSVLVTGTSQGTNTDMKGEYSLDIPAGSKSLTFTFVGMQPQEILIGTQTHIDVTMAESSVGLGEVVVVGYGTTTARKLTTSISKIDAKQLSDLPIANVASSFTGNVSGVLVEEGSGAPGAVPVIRVRGYGSINAGSDPLYVIDGMIVTSTEFRLLNPKSVASVNVLKDAAAGAIYGSRAGNGVVIITTKSGEGKAKFSYNATVGLQKVERKIPVLSGPEFIKYSKEAYAASGQPEPVFASDVANTNWQDEIFRTGFIQNHQLAANGSTDRIKYNVSFNYLGEEGIILTTYENNYSSNGNFDMKLSNKLNLGITYNATYTKSRVNNKLGGAAHGSGGILEDAIVQYPVIPVYMPNGDYGQQVTKDWGTPVVYNGYGNPVAGLNEIHDYRYGFSGIGRTFLNYEPVKGLNVNVSFNGILGTSFRNYNESPYLAADGHSNNANFSHPRYDNILAGQSNDIRLARTIEGFIDYKHTFGEAHNFDIIAGFSNEYRGYRSTAADASVNDRGANADDPLPRFNDYLRPNIWGANDVTGSGSFTEETFASIFTRVNYDYKDKYILMASVRRDGSSKFAPGNRYGIFPAISAAWRISEEEFMKSQNLFDDLKLRLSYGVSGNDQIGSYSWQGKATYGGFQYLYGPAGGSVGPITTSYPSSLENPNLRWETNEQYNLGIDFSILKSRITLASDFYIRNTKDLLLQRPLPAENGVTSSIMDNIGDLTNKGIELNLTTVNIEGPNFTWTTGWIFNKVWNKATAIHSEDGILRLNSGAYDMIWIIEGQEMFQIYGYKAIGVFKTDQQLSEYPRPRGSKIGDPIYEDVNKDGELNSDDLQKLGHALPSFTYGWANTFTYKNFDLNIVLDGSQGASKYIPAFRNQSWVSPIEGNLSKYVYDRAGTVFGASNLDYTGNRLERCSYHVFDASYLRIKNLTIGYNLPDRVCKSLDISRLRVTLNASNLYTFTSYPWYCPQANYYNGAAGAAQFGVDYGSYPLARSFTIGVNMTF